MHTLDSYISKEHLSDISPIYVYTSLSIIILLAIRADVKIGGGIERGITIALALFVAGYICLTLAEYLVHRFLFHKKIPGLEFMRKKVHGIHHRYPKQILFLPLVVRTLVLAAIFVVFFLLLGPWSFLFFAGFCSGLLFLNYIHESSHTGDSVPTFLQHLIAHHQLHHTRYPNHAFGTSTTVRDKLFGTMPPPSPTKKVLK